MKRLIILLFASLVTVGLLMACTNPSSQPMNGNGNGNGNGDGNGDGNGEPPPPAVVDLDLTLKGWTTRAAEDDDTTANIDETTAVEWMLEIVESGANRAPETLYLVFTDGGNDLGVYTAASAATACDGLTDLDVVISGLTITFDGTIGTAANCALFAGVDVDGDGDDAAGPADGDKLAFSITLDNAPNTMAVDVADAEDQDIGVTGMVTITRGTGSSAEEKTLDIRGEVTYMTPTITTQPASQ